MQPALQEQLPSPDAWLQEPARRHCRACGQAGIIPFFPLGKMPLNDRLLRPEALSAPEFTATLTMAYCPACTLVQIRETVAPAVLFADNYPYYSSVSPALLEHSRLNAEDLIRRRQLNANSQVVEIASNDGYMLRNFHAAGIPVLGIDPAQGPAAVAQRQGIQTLCKFFGSDLATQLSQDGLSADVILANNVLAHVADLNGLVDGIRILLKPAGVAVIEVPYVTDLIDKCEFDTVYHQHLCYFSVTALDRLFRAHDLSLNDVRRIPIHGGSLRLYVEHQPNQGPSVQQLLQMERETGVSRLDHYQAFARRARHIKLRLHSLLRHLRQQGKRIVAYGAAAKGTTLMTYCGIDQSLIDYVVDLSPYKHGLFMCGNKLPIKGVEALMRDLPEYVLMLAWNFRDEILQQQAAYRAKGGRFIIPIPPPEIV
jgi:SAM-dependent methyltransferase